MKIIYALLIGLAFTACSTHLSNDNPLLIDANRIHLEAEAIQEQVEPEIEKIDSLKNSLLARKTIAADSLVKELTRIKADFEKWEANFFAVPGFEHDHTDKHEHHHHDHLPSPELPADKMLEVQREIKVNIERIQTDLSRALAEAKEVLK